jgi:hypothetical protein
MQWPKAQKQILAHSVEIVTDFYCGIDMIENIQINLQLFITLGRQKIVNHFLFK